MVRSTSLYATKIWHLNGPKTMKYSKILEIDTCVPGIYILVLVVSLLYTGITLLLIIIVGCARFILLRSATAAERGSCTARGEAALGAERRAPNSCQKQKNTHFMAPGTSSRHDVATCAIYTRYLAPTRTYRYNSRHILVLVRVQYILSI